MSTSPLRENLRNRLLAIHDRLQIPLHELAKGIGVQFNTMKLFMRDPDCTRYETLKKFNEYITRKEEDLEVK